MSATFATVTDLNTCAVILFAYGSTTDVMSTEYLRQNKSRNNDAQVPFSFFLHRDKPQTAFNTGVYNYMHNS